MKALINRIIEFSNVDGPGNRLAIFFQGCSFSCQYCHNPETIGVCNDCGACVLTCPSQALSKLSYKVEYDKGRCLGCDTCIKTCKYNCDPRAQEYEVEELLAIIQDNQAYIRGITVSGGECMLYPEFLTELFKETKKLKLTCLIDSNGDVDFKMYPELLTYCDGVMLDVKAADNDYHRQLTGSDNYRVKENLDYLLSIGKLAEVRTVLLPRQKISNQATIAFVLSKVGNQCDYKLIKYRHYGVNEIGIRAFGNQPLGQTEYQALVDYAKELGAKRLILV